ncbi:MAG: hypothetical protein ABIP51_07995 [Bacteroidia bacterium]
MFWDKWIPKKYLVKSEVCAIEACFNDNGLVYYYSHLKNKNNKLEIVQTGFSEDKIELPKNIEKNKIPIVLIVNGKGIILKKITLSQEGEQPAEELIRQNLPAINPAEFFIQLFKQNDQSAFIALCRKEQVNTIVTELKNKKYEVADVLLGAPVIIGLQPLWSDFNSIQTSLQRIELSNGFADVITANTNNENIKIDDLSFSSHQTLGFAGGLSYLMQNPIAENDSEEIVTIKTSHVEKNKFRFLMIGVVAIAFIVAIVNVVFYTSYFDKNNKLETELSVYQGKYDQINELLSSYQQKKGLIENAGILNKNKLSEYADKIGTTIPKEVVLSELYFNPKNEDVESEDSLVTFYNKKLVLKGNCNKSLIVNEWLNVLKMQNFVNDVSLEKFNYNNEGLLPNFEIRITTK